MRFADTYSSRPSRFHPSPHERKEEGTRDLELLRKLQAGEEQAFWVLWIRHSRRLLAVCLREMNGNRVDAEDALQEAMLRAYEKLPRFAAGITNPTSWLIRMTSNICKDVYRDRARRDQLVERLKVLQSGSVQLPEVQQRDARSDDYDPVILAALLPDPLRRVFILHILQHVSYRDIASHLGLTCVTVRKRVQLSRAALRAWRNDNAA